MTELQPIQDFFDDPDFVVQFDSWRARRKLMNETSDALYDTLVSEFGSDDEALNATKERVSYMLEEIDGMTDEQFAESYQIDMFSDEALQIRNHMGALNETQEYATQGLVGLGEMNGLGSFALYGLRRQLQIARSPINHEDVRLKVFDTNDRLTRINEAVRSNIGNVVLHIGIAAVRGGRLNGGGLVVRGDDAVFPVEQCHVMSFSRDMPDIYLEEMKLSLHSLEDARLQIVSGTDVLNVNAWEQEHTLAFGNLPVGPPHVMARNLEDAEYYVELFDKVRKVSNLAIPD